MLIACVTYCYQTGRTLFSAVGLVPHGRTVTDIVWHARYTLLALLHAPHWEAGPAVATGKHYAIITL
jgi:hypothetical protein